jgi:predicted MFS family arabinose efflux permease
MKAKTYVPATNSIAYGVVADIATPAERGSFVTIISFAYVSAFSIERTLTPQSVTMAPSFGPMLGGALTYAAGWHWIFWFLCIAAGFCLLLMIMFLPETCRAIVQNGGIAPPRYLRLPVQAVMCHWEHGAFVNRPKSRVPNPLTSLIILLRKDNAVIILAAGILYLVYACVCTSLSVIFEDVYGLNQWQVGLVYLPFGLGGTVSTFFSGRLLNNAYEKARTKEGLSTDKVTGDDLDCFDIEKARLGIIWVPLLITAASLVSYGWVLHFKEVR